MDEAINVIFSQRYNLFDFLTVYSLGDFHPPLHFGILWIWTRMFGASEIVVRIPSVIFGVLTVWLTYLIGKKLFTAKTGLIAAAILAFNPLHVYYSQEARMYSLAAFSASFSFWSLMNLLRERKYFVLIYGASVLMVLYSDYVAYLTLVAQFIYVFWLERKKMAKFLLATITGGFFWIPWLFIFPSQLKTGQAAAVQIPGWAGVVGGANLKEILLLGVKSMIGRVSFDNMLVYGVVIFFTSSIYGFTFFKAIKPLTKEVKLILLWITVPVGIAFMISFYVPIFAYFRMIYILPPVAVLLGLGIEKFSGISQKLLLGLILLISLIFLMVYYLNPKFQREDWKGAISYVKEKNAYVFFEDSNIPAPAQYYQCETNCFPAIFNFPAKSESDLVDLKSLTTYQNRVYLFNYFVEISDPSRLVARKLEEAGFKITATKDFSGVGFVYEYSK